MSTQSPDYPHHDGHDRRPIDVSAEFDIGVDLDQAARSARGAHLIAEIDRVRVLASGHGGEDPVWREVATLLDALRATLSRDFSRPAPGTRSSSSTRPFPASSSSATRDPGPLPVRGPTLVRPRSSSGPSEPESGAQPARGEPASTIERRPDLDP
jgi:hypothetical protein